MLNFVSVGKSTVAVTSVGCENTHTKVPIWGAKFNSTIQCKSEALCHWTESPSPVSAPSICSDGEPNKIVYVSNWLHNALSPTLLEKLAPGNTISTAITTSYHCTTATGVFQPEPIPANKLNCSTLRMPMNDHLYKIFILKSCVL